MYLVEGANRCVLLDTGFGVGDLGSFVRRLTDKPVTVLLTHGHLDHAFGAAWFDDVRMSPLDTPIVAAHRLLSESVMEEARAQGRVTAEVPDPTRFAPLAAGDLFDLGGLTVRTIAAAGHTPGSMAFLIAEERVLLTGDAANQFTFMFDDSAASIAEYQQTLSQVRADTAGLYDRVYLSHGTGIAPFSIFDDLDRLCTKVRARNDDAVPFEFMGMKALIARKVAGQGPVDDNANIVYNPDAI
jgi:glyoxylase-like metal-dependent hydrolase (beta-lactamase superfamily II)